MDDTLSNSVDTSTRVVNRTIEDELRESFIDYSMSVIVQRALPDARDGLKPVHRRILYAMSEAGLLPSRPFKKSATVVGDVLGKYHPHGDSAVYDALVRMVQTFSLAEPLIDGQGNYGSIDGDSAAAYRYTEARLSPVAMDMLEDLDKDTVDFQSNFDDRLEEPKVLPSKVPNLLLNGSTGIAVGMATNVPPHNLQELAAVIELLCERPDVDDESIFKLVQGPDFPTGALVLDEEGIKSFMRKGVGRIVMRARAHVEKASSGRTSIIITEIPYQVVKGNIIQKISELVRDKKIEGIAALRDESDRKGIAIRVELKRDGDPKKVLDFLYKYTELQKTFGAKLLALVNGQPKILPFRRAIEIFIQHRLEVIVRRTTYDLNRAKGDLHILEGLLIALSNIDKVIQIIKESRTPDSAKNKLIKEFSLSERQAQAILNMRLSRLTALEVSELKKQAKELKKLISELEALLADPKKQRMVVRDETREVAEKYSRPRRTQIISAAEAENIAQQAAEEHVRVYVSTHGFTWSEPVGKRARARSLEVTDPAQFAIRAPSTDRLVLFGSSGKYYPLDVGSVPASGARPRPVSSIVQGMDKKENVMYVAPKEQLEVEGLSVIFVTSTGQVKRTSASEYSSPKAGGVLGVGLSDGDEIVSIFTASPEQDVFIATATGQVIRFNLSSSTGVPEQGRAARGVRGVKLNKNDRVVSAGVMGTELSVISKEGYVKNISMEEFPVQGRGGAGVKLVRSTEKTGEITWVGARPKHVVVWVQTEGNVQVPVLLESFPSTSRTSLGDCVESLKGASRVESTPEMLLDRLVRRLSEGAFEDDSNDESSDDPQEVDNGEAEEV